MRRRVAAQREQRRRRLGRDHGDAGAPLLQPRRHFQRAQIMPEPHHVRRPVRLGQHDPGRPRRHHRSQIGQRVRRGERVDPHPQPRPGMFAQECGNKLARRRQVGGRHQVLQVEDQRIRLARQPLGQLALGIARHEQPRSRRHASTSASVAATTSVALNSASSGRRSSARWALASSMLRGPAPYSAIGTPAAA